MCTYLDQVGSTYYFRRVVPVELRPLIRTRSGQPRSEWKLSLRTKDRDEAKRLIPHHTLSTQAEIDAAERARRTNAPENGSGSAARRIDHRTDAIIAAMAERTEADAEAASRHIADKEAQLERLAPIIARFERAFRKSTLERSDEESAVLHMLRDQQLDFTMERERKAMAALARVESRRGIVARPMEPVVVERVAAKPGLSLLDAFDSYAVEQQIKPNTASEWRAAVKALTVYLGHDDANRVTVENLGNWRDALLSEVTKRKTNRQPRTVRNGYFTPVIATLNWLVENHKLAENAAAKVRVRVPRKAKLRERDFTSDEAKAILSATLVAPKNRVTPLTAKARRWIPWLCAYTGARVNEISQLRGKDITQIDGIWTIRITPEAGTVKANAARVVPLHPHLIEQGFPAVAAKAGDGPVFYDPAATRRPGVGNRHFKKVGERLAKWVREDVEIADPAIQPNHAWRHTFKTMSRAVEMPEIVSDAITGHAPKSVGQTYGSVPLRTLADAIAKLPRFEVEDRG